MDAVIILFRKRIDPVKPDMEKQFLVASWAESLKVLIVIYLIVIRFMFLTL